VTFRFIQREGDYPTFAPDFESLGDGKPKENAHGFSTIDHVTSNAYTMLPVVHWYRDVLGFTHYWDVEFHTADVDGGKKMTGSGLRSIVMADPESGIKFATNEPMMPFFRESQINRFCEDHHGAGVQHIARQSHPCRGPTVGGCFLPAPDLYYDKLPKRLAGEADERPEPMGTSRNYILVDGPTTNTLFMLDRRPCTATPPDRSSSRLSRAGDKGSDTELPRPLRVDRGEPARPAGARGRRLID
jgi:4-hydroxyphenylpyruvate dioxygenase